MWYIGNMNDENLIEKKIDSREVYNGRLLHVFNDKVLLPNGNEAGRDLIRHVGAVCVIPILEDGRVIIEHQFRYPINEVIIEIPAGKLDSKSEDHLEACKRELREETGYEADEWIDIGPLYPTAAYSDEVINAYIARNLRKGERNLDDDEFINIELVPLEELVELVMDGRIPDAKSQIAILKAARMLGL